MSLYLIALFYIPLFFLPISNRRTTVFFKLIFVFIYTSYIFIHYDAGPDHSIYRWAYLEPERTVFFEPFYLIVSQIARLLSLDYEGFLLFFRGINVLIFSYFVFKLDKFKLIFFLSLYIPISFITFELNLLRQCFALHLGLLSALFISENKRGLAILFFILASATHLSSILMIFLFFNRANKFVMLMMFAFLCSLAVLLPLLIERFNAYQEIGGLDIRTGPFLAQLIVLMVLPFIFFSFEKRIVPVWMYVFVCIFSFVPVLVRLYPLALLLLLPIATYSYKRTDKIYILLIISFLMCILKTNLLITADDYAIKEGVYEKGYR